VESLRQSGIERPLAELRLVPKGRRIAVRIDGQEMDAISGQILLDFEQAAGGVRTLPAPVNRDTGNADQEQAALYFQRGLALEEADAPVEQVVEAYRSAIRLNPRAAGAWVNLGTIYYRERRFREAEESYRKAVEADPGYPLAHFNLGNLFDERGDLQNARKHYETALRLNANYADAHFNLALLCERAGEILKSLHHWRVYLKLDASSSWASIARREMEKLRHATVVGGTSVSRPK
jgi:tetratricopeptide (TPR) repeat protein